MPKDPPVYSQLTRSVGGVGTYSNLWLGRDHLLIVQSIGFSESYQRVLFADIQGFFITASSRRFYWSWFWGVPTAIAGIRVGVVLWHQQTPLPSAILFGICALFLCVNLALGSTCTVYLKTRVQTARLPSLVRKR